MLLTTTAHIASPTLRRRYLEILQKQRLEFEDILGKRLREQEHSLAQQYATGLQEEEATIRKVLEAALEAQKYEHDEDKKVFEESKSAEIRSVLDEQYGTKMEAYKKEVAEELKQKVAALESLSAKLKHLETALSSIKTSQRGSLKAHRLSAAALALAEKLETNQPAAAEFETLKVAVGRDAGVISAALVTVPESVASTGVPTLSELQARFEQVHKRSREAAFVPLGRQGLEGQLAGKLFATLTFAPDPEDAAPESDKDNAQYVLVRARKHVQLGELESAVEQLEKLEGQPAFTVADWKQDAMNRIVVEKALKVIKMECALVNESLAE